MPRHADNTPRPWGCRPWGSHYAAVTPSSTDKARNFVDGFAFMERDGPEGLSWQHIEDVAAYDEDDLEERYTVRAREQGIFEYMPGPAWGFEDESRPDAPGFSWQGEKKDSESGDADVKERGFKGMFGPRVKKRSDMREFFRPVEESGSGSRVGSSGEAKESASNSKKGFGFGAKGKGPAGKK